MIFKELLEKLLGQKTVSVIEKAKLRKLFKALSEEEQEESAEQVDEALEKPESSEGDEGGEGEESAGDDDGGEEKSINELVRKLGIVVEKSVKNATKDLKFSGRPDLKPESKNVFSSKEQKLKLVEKILEPTDKGHYQDLETNEERTKFLNTARNAYFFKSLVRFAITKDPEHLAVVKALAEGTDDVGGYLTPTNFRAQLVRDLRDLPIMRNLVTVFPVTSDSTELPTLASDVKTSWGSENTTISTTTARFGTLSFTPFRLNTFMYTSRELVADSAINVIQLITTLFAEAIGREEDRVIINGSGSGQPKGILQETLAGIDNANVDADLADNIKRLPYRLGTRFRARARWVMNSLTLAQISQLKDTNGAYHFRAGLEQGDIKRLVSYEVMEQNDMPLDTILFGDFSQYFLADRERVSVETTTEGAGTFEKHQVAIKIVERIDGKVAQTVGFRSITNAGVD